MKCVKVDLQPKRARSAGGIGKVQWRTAAQEGFSASGEVIEFSLASAAEWSESTVFLPVAWELFGVGVLK